MLSDAQLVRVVLTHQQAVKATRTRVKAFVTRYWQDMGSWRDADMERFIATVVPVIEGGQRTIYQLTDAYLTTIIINLSGGGMAIPRAGKELAVDFRGIPASQVYLRPGSTVYNALSEGKPIEDAVKLGLYRLQDLIDMDMQLAQTHAARDAMNRSDRVVGYRRVLTGSENCALCVLASTQRYHKENLMPIHPGCVPGSALVSGEGVLAITRRRYSGELTVITTAGGDEVTVTPNHPVLTEQGWVPAHLVREGDYLFHRPSGHRVGDGRPDEGHAPVPIEDVWRALDVTGLSVVPLTPEDFHGDGADGEVDIVWTDGDLPPVGDVSFGEPDREICLVAGHRSGVTLASESGLTPLLEGACAPTCGSVRGRGLRFALCGRHLGRTQQTSRTSITRLDAPKEEFSLDSAAGYASRGVDLIRRLAGQVERDRVINTRRVYGPDHVYNLHTVGGWYASNNHIVSNCDCSVAPIIGDRDPGQVINEPLLRETDAQMKAAGVTDTHGIKNGKRDASSLMVRDHGEYGPTLTWRDQKFTGAATVE